MTRSLKTVISSVLLLSCTAALAQDNLGIAQYTVDGQLQYPANLKEWIQTGASIGGDYGEKPFDPQSPGSIGVVQMEPTAYRYFIEHKTYAEGTMFLLSFFKAEGKSEPQLPGFVQGAMTSQEIHVLDKTRFNDDHGFFMFANPQQATSTRIPEGNPCTTCHNEHGKFDGTFIQFYPDLRAHLGMGDGQ